MKTKLVMAVCLVCSAPLFAGKSAAGPALSAVCTGTVSTEDSCRVTASGLTAGKVYRLDVRSNCGDMNSTTFKAVSGSNSVTIIAPESNGAACTTSTFFFYLYLGTKQVQTTSASD